jgi:hypothetical protein
VGNGRFKMPPTIAILRPSFAICIGGTGRASHGAHGQGWKMGAGLHLCRVCSRLPQKTEIVGDALAKTPHSGGPR